MGFQLSDTVDRNKVFLVRRSKIEGRLDPLMALYRRKVRRFRYQTHQLAKLLKIPPRYGANEAGKTRANNEEPRYIRITDIDAHGLLKNEIGVTAEIIEPKYILKNNDILFARSGATVGKAYIHKIKNVEYPCFYAGYMIRFVFNDDMVDPDYVFSFTQLNIYKEWVQVIQRAAGQPNINAEEYKSLMIPLPPVKVQNKIVSKMNAAYSAKKEKEAEAQRLLDSIDDYMLKELGIELPEEEDNTIQQRMFVCRFSEVSEGRLDPIYYSKHIKKIKAIMIDSWGKHTLQEIIEDLYRYPTFYGITYLSEGIPIIKGENIDQNGEISPNQQFDYIDDYTHNKYFRTHLQEGDLVFTVRGVIGKVGLFKGVSEFANINANVMKIRLKEEVNIFFYWNYLNSKIGQIFIRNLESGQVQKTITVPDIKKIPIPLPPLPKQEKIATHIHSIRSKAKQLRYQADAELEQAKKEVEKMILGDTD